MCSFIIFHLIEICLLIMQRIVIIIHCVSLDNIVFNKKKYLAGNGALRLMVRSICVE